MLHPLPRLLAEDPDILGFATLGERLGLLDPLIAFDAALEIQITIHPVALGLLPAGNLRIGEDAELVKRAFDLRANA